jgi:transcriptional antiterminator
MKICLYLLVLSIFFNVWPDPLSAETSPPIPEKEPAEISFHLAEDQDGKPDEQKTIILSWMKEEKTSLTELTSYLSYVERTIEQYILLYNVTHHQVQKIHDDPDLPSLTEMPPILTLHRSVPHSAVTLEHIKQRYRMQPSLFFSPGAIPRKERE